MILRNSRPPGVAHGREFRTTCWKQVEAAAGNDEAAKEALCREYWYPLYVYLRRSGRDRAEAQDLVQGFFANLLGKQELKVADPGKGRFRSFLLGTLKHHLSDERKRAEAQKRGGGEPLVSLDIEQAEARYRVEPAAHASPEELFDRHWGFDLLTRVLTQIQARYERSGRAVLFAELRPCLGGSGALRSYAEIGAKVGKSEDSVKVAAHRLRQLFGRMLRAEVAGTVGDSSEIDDELRYLLRVTSQ